MTNVEIAVIGDAEWNKVWINGQAFPRHFYAQFPDGREDELTGIVVHHGETVLEATERTRKELGAVAIVLKPPKDQEAQVTAG